MTSSKRIGTIYLIAFYSIRPRGGFRASGLYIAEEFLSIEKPSSTCNVLFVIGLLPFLIRHSGRSAVAIEGVWAVFSAEGRGYKRL